MDLNIVIRTIFPIFLLMSTGFLSRKVGILKAGDERVLSAFVYYFALPALFFVNMSEIKLTEETLRFMLVGPIPIFIVLAIYILLYLILRFSKNTLYLLVLSTVFGSLSFFGIPFITFAFPTELGKHMATLSSASISPISVAISITVLELYKFKEASIWLGLKKVLKSLSKNPLIISIFLGILTSFFKIKLPSPLSVSLHMLGGTTSTVAIFMLGVFLYGRNYRRINTGLKLVLLRAIFLPIVALLTTMLFSITGIERSVLVLMHSMPLAISTIVLSERYDFYTDTLVSLSLVSSVSAGIYLNLWFLLLSYL